MKAQPILVVTGILLLGCGAATLLRHAAAPGSALVTWLGAGISGILAVWFARLLFVPPKPVAK